MTLPEIEAMQAMLTGSAAGAQPLPAARHRALEEGPAEHDTRVNFIAVSEEDAFKALGPLEDIVPVVFEEDREPEFDEDEVRWWNLSDPEGGA